MRTIFVLAAALAILAPNALAGVPGPGDVIREYDRARETLIAALQVAHADIRTDLEGAEVGGVVRIEGTARAEEGFAISAIRFYVDHLLVGSAPRGETWSFDLDTRRLIDGAHEFSVTVVAAPIQGDYAVVGLSGGDAVAFRTLNHVVGVVLHEATYEGIDARTHLWETVLDQRYVALKMTITLQPNGEAPVLGGPLLGEAVLAYHEQDGVEPTKTWVATFGLLKGGATVISRPPHDELAAGGKLALAGGFVGDGRITIRIEALPWP